MSELTPRWKVCLIVLPELAKSSRLAIKNLQECGFDTIDIFAPRGVPLPDGDCLVRHRCEPNLNEAELFLAAITSVSGNFVLANDFILYIRADVVLWPDAKLLMEHTIEPQFIAAYFPYAPDPFLQGDSRPLPCSGARSFGWCAVEADQPFSGIGCLAMNKHTAMYLAGSKDWVFQQHAGMPWSHVSAKSLRSLEVKCYAHTPSLGYINEYEQETAVPFGKRLDPRFKECNLYLN